MSGIVDTILYWLKLIIVLLVVLWLGWLAITNAEALGNFVVTVVNAIKTFFTTVWNGVF